MHFSVWSKCMWLIEWRNPKSTITYRIGLIFRLTQFLCNGFLGEKVDDVIKWKLFPCGEFYRSPVDFPSQKPATRSFDVFFDLHLKKRLSKQSKYRWLETPSRLLWRHCNDNALSVCVEHMLMAWYGNAFRNVDFGIFCVVSLDCLLQLQSNCQGCLHDCNEVMMFSTVYAGYAQLPSFRL